jgi:Glycosyl transferase family 2
MLESPRLTICIPTFNRPDKLPRALNSALSQFTQGTVEPLPVRIIVSDNGDARATHDLLKADYAPQCISGQIIHMVTEADHAWPNWRAGAEAAETEFVAWLQDDDIITEVYADRVISAFDAYPNAKLWLARCLCAPDGQMALWYSGNGPFVPMDFRGGRPFCLAEGSVLASTSYFTSWALAPGFAFRNGEPFKRALREIPDHCDIFVERLMPALVARGSAFIADPVVAGYWIQHPDQLSRKLHKRQPEETKRFMPVMNQLLSELPEWQKSLADWCQVVPAATLLQWIGQAETTCKEGGGSPHKDEIQSILMESLRGRIKFGWKPPLWWQRGIGWLRGKISRKAA